VSRIFEVDGVTDPSASRTRRTLERPVVIASDDDLVCVRLTSKKCIERLDLGKRTTSKQVTGVDENIAFRKVDGFVEAVGITDGDDSN